jgi:type III secretion protein V
MIMLDTLTRTLVAVSRRGDLAVAGLVLVAIVMMIVPLPTAVVDLLITANIAGSVLILLIAFYVAHPLEFSTLPSVILIATLFRLAITITTARLVLLQADAGELINAFGSFVVGGNIAVGLVVFLIITVAQFVVITKGSERVAEVAARFTLDALPGRQMSIDSDLRNGDIDQSEARRQRRRLGQESQLYGAMDGAMKFVKGDAIASLVIIMVNLIGGLIVGTLQHDMSLALAAETYSLLTVGDGLVAQIPALLVSVAAGTVVTRVASEERHDLGSEISSQLLNDPRALGLGGAILFGLAFMPGFPTPAFVALAGVFALAAWLAWRRQAAARAQQVVEQQRAAGAERTEPQPPAVAEAVPRHRVAACIGQALFDVVPAADFARLVGQVRQDLVLDLGVEAPAVDLSVDHDIEANRFHIDIESVPVAEGDIRTASVLVDDDPMHLELLAVPFDVGPRLIGRRPSIWVERSHQPTLAEAGIEFLVPAQVLASCLARTLRRHATQFVGIQETRELLARMERDFAELVKEAQKVAPLQKISEVLRRLLQEDVPIRNLRLILEALIEWAPREQDVVSLVEYVRMALCRQICFRCADRNRVIAAHVLERPVEDAVRSFVRPTAVGPFLSIPDRTARPIVEQIRAALSAAPDARPVVLASMDVRRHVRNLLVRNDLDAPVLSYQELAAEFSVQPLTTIVAEPESIVRAAEQVEQVEPARQASEHPEHRAVAPKMAARAR